MMKKGILPLIDDFNPVLMSLFVFAFSITSVPSLLAQSRPTYVNNNNATGNAPFGTYLGSDRENINLANGNLNLKIPLISLPGRGVDASFGLTYDSKIWQVQSVTFSWGTIHSWALESRGSAAVNDGPSEVGVGWSLNLPRLTWTYQLICTQTDPQGNCLNWTIQLENYILTLPDGGKHAFPNGQTDPFWSAGNNKTVGYTEDSSHMQLDLSTNTVMLKDGTKIVFGGAPGQPEFSGSRIVDSNGNFIGIATNMGVGVSTITDTLGRNMTFTYISTCPSPPSGSCLDIVSPGGLRPTQQTLLTGMTAVDSEGIPRSYTFSYSAYDVKTNFPSSDVGNSGPNAEVFLNRVTMPNSQSYQFTYNFQYVGSTVIDGFGELTQIIYPTGGSVRYDYQTLANFDWGYFAGAYLQPDTRVVAHRFVSPDSPSLPWTYEYTPSRENINAPGAYDTGFTTITDPYGNKTRRAFKYIRTATPNGNLDSTVPFESRVEFYNGVINPSNLLSSVDKTWRQDILSYQALYNTLGFRVANFRTSSETTTLDNGSISRTEPTYSELPTPYCTGANCFYTPDGNVIEVKEYDYGSGAVGPLLRRSTFSYLHDTDLNYRNRRIMDRVATKSVYDGLGTLKAQTTYNYDVTTPITATSNVVQHDYANYSSQMPYRGNLNQTRQGLYTNGAWVWLDTTNWYDDLGNLIQSQDPIGNVTQYSYSDNFSDGNNSRNTRAYLTQITPPAAEPGANQEIVNRRYYYYTGLLEREIDPRGQATTYQYDNMNRPTTTTRPGEGTTRVIHNDGLRFVDSYECANAAQCALSPPQVYLLHTQQEYDGLGRLSKSRAYNGVEGNTIAEQQYDALGRVWRVSNPYAEGIGTAQWTETTYDALDRPRAVRAPDNTVTQMDYPGANTLVTDPAGKKRLTEENAAGRLIHVWEDYLGKNYQTDYAYDVLNNQVQVNQGGQLRIFNYDSLSRLVSASNPETGPPGANGEIRYEYYDNGLLKRKTDPRETNPLLYTTTYAYDALNRLKSKTYAVLPGSISTPSVSYTYGLSTTDGLSFGRLKTTSTGAVTYNYAYHAMGWVTQKTMTIATVQGVTLPTNFSYDALGHTVQIQYPSGRVVQQGYDNSGLLRTVSSSSAVSTSPAPAGTYLSSLRYWPHGAVRIAIYGNGLDFSSAYNERLQPVSLVVGGTSAVMNLDYSYNYFGPNNGNVHRMRDLVGTPKEYFFTYDGLNRIISAYGSGFPTQQDYSYDRWGNLARAYNLTDGQVAAYYPGYKNRRVGMIYDDAGNQTNDGTHSYTYDAENRIVKVDNGATAAYEYDSDGQRVKRTAGGVTTYYVYGLSGEVLTEYVVDNGLTASQTQAPASDGSAGTVVHYLYGDHLGTPRVITDQTGAVVSRHDYYPFGDEITNPNQPDGETHKFTSKERDAESALDYFGKRYLSSQQGRFMSIDPGRDQLPDNPQSWNLYTYTRNNPLNAIDPDGGFVFTLFGAVTGALSGGISAYVNDTDIRAGVASGALAGVAAGAVTDLTIATGGGALAVIGAAALSGAVGGAVGSTSTQFAEGAETINTGQVGLEAFKGAALGTLTGAAGVIGQKAAVTVQHFTNDEFRGLITASENIKANVFVTKPGQVPAGSTAVQAERILVLEPGKGANNITFTTTRGNLGVPANGRKVPGTGAYQRQLKEPVTIDPKTFRKTPEQ